MAKEKKGVMLYDFLAVQGGAEKLTLTLLKSFPDVTFCCAFRDKEAFPDSALPSARCIDLNASSNIPLWRLLKVMRTFEKKTSFLADYDWALFSGVYAPLAVRNRTSGINILYCHTIPRFAYDLRKFYMSRLLPIFWPVFWGLVLFMRKRYCQALSRMDMIIVNSNNVKRRLKRYLDKSATVIYPPVDTDRFRWLGQKDYYVSLARLENFKRVDLIVEAFKRMPEKQLVVTSSGTEMARLKETASGASNIRFTGWQMESELKTWIGNAVAAIYIPIDEDFGMSPVEAMAAGKPVIGVAEGGLLETVVPNQTGILMNSPPTVEEIISAVRDLTPKRALEMRSACELQARQFSRQIFIDKMRMVIGRYA